MTACFVIIYIIHLLKQNTLGEKKEQSYIHVSLFQGSKCIRKHGIEDSHSILLQALIFTPAFSLLQKKTMILYLP